jgi:hypothetical protein
VTVASRGLLLWLAPVIAGPVLSPAMAASDQVATELARCAAIATSQARLTCYDALAGRNRSDEPAAVQHAADTVPGAMPSAEPSAAATAASVLRSPPSPVASAAATAPAPVAASAPTDPAQSFGLSAAQLHAAPQGPQFIQARIAEVRVDQLRRSSVVLDNGQVWASTEGEMLLDAGEAVTISRAALGSFMLTSASKHAYHVRRLH